MSKKLSGKTLKITESALMIALSAVLSVFTVVQFPFGGSVTLFSQVPIIILSYRYGVKWGLVSGFTLSVLQLLFGLNNFSYVNGIAAYLVLIFVDYLIPFTLLGLGGIFRNKFKGQVSALALGSVLVSCIRFVCHFVSGVTIWKSWAPSSATKAIVIYSLTYNGSYMLPELVITVIGACLIGRFVDLKKERLFG